MAERAEVVRLVRGGRGQREVARQMGVPLSTVQHWLRRAGAQPLKKVDFGDRRPGLAVPVNRTQKKVEQAVLRARATLAHGALGFCGAVAIAEELEEASLGGAGPSVRTIGRILQRQGALSGRERRRATPPPPGWYLPAVASGRAELESFDVIEDLRLEGGPLISVLTGRALWGGEAAAWPLAHCKSEQIVESLLEHWRQRGLPAYVQFDNDTRFQGSHRYPDLVGRVVRLCLQAGVTPVFAPPREPGFQNLIESFNGLWQAKVWARFHHEDLRALRERNAHFLRAWHARLARRERAAAPRRRRLRAGWVFEEEAPLAGELIYLRRCDEAGAARLLGHEFAVDAAWGHRLVRAEVDLAQHRVRFFGLRRQQPAEQPFLGEHAHRLPAFSVPRARRRT